MSMHLLAHVVIGAALAAGSTFADEWTKTFAVAGRPEVRVETDDGAVTVKTWDEKRIAARVTTSGWKIAPGEVEIRESQSGDRVELVVRSPRRHFNFFGGNRKIQVDLQVPRQIHSDIRTGDGGIHVSGLAGETRLRTGDGSIEADFIDGSLEVGTGDGSVHVSGRMDMLTLHTGDGAVQADVLPGSRMTSGWRVETGDGGVTIRLPGDFATELDVHTGDGHISTDFPLTTTVDGHHGKDLRARINGGGAPFYIRTGDGSIHLGRI